MNLKNLLKIVFVTVLLTLISSATFAQTFFVNNQSGNDANPGSQALPKLTVASAIIAAPPGSTISIANTGIAYTEGNITINKALSFTSTGGMPIFANASIDVQVNTTFAGPLQFVNLTLTAGEVTGATNLTVSGNVTRSVPTAVVDGQINYTAGAHNFTYGSGGGAAVTSGGELPAAGDLTHLGNLTTVGAATVLTLNSAKQINGILNTAAGLDLGGNTVTIAGASVGHALGGNVTNGTLAFVITGATTITGAVTIPNVTATKTTNGIAVLNITNVTSMQSLLVSGMASVNVNHAATIGDASSTANNLVNSGSGVVSILRAGAVTINGNVLLNSSVDGRDNAAALLANEGQIVFGQGGALIVNGSVTNDATITVAASDNAALANTGAGLITFADQGVTITGNLVNDVSLIGAVSATAPATDANLVGNIVFANAATDVTVNGSITNSASTNISSAAAVTVANNGRIVLLLLTTGDLRADGGITISSNFSSLTNAGVNGNGTILIGAAGVRTAGSSVGTGANRVGAVSVSSSAAANGRNGSLIINGDNTSGGFFGTSVSISGTVGGQLLFDDEDFNITGGVSNARSAADPNTPGDDVILIGNAARAAAIVSVGGGLTNSANTDIIVNVSSTGNVTITGVVTSSAAGGQITFPNITSGSMAMGGINLSAGTINVPASHSSNINVNGAWTVSGGTLNLLSDASGDDIAVSQTIHPNIEWTGGTINFTGRDDIQIGSINTTIGGPLANPTFTSAVAELVFVEPLPNVVQNIMVGGASPVYPGPVTIANAANIPAPIVHLLPANGATVANLYVLNDVTFNAGTVLNSVQLDGVHLNVGKNGVGGGNGNFQNTTGYTTINGGLVMMSGTSGAQTVNAGAVTAGATLGTFGVDNERDPLPLDGVAEVTFGAGTVFTTDFYLAEGDVDLTGTTFSGSAPNWPIVFRSEGAFITAPTVAAGTKISITYYGFDKATGLEIPAGATVLWNLTVSTTNGAQAGFGIVNMSGNATVNGTLTIDANQTLYTAANTLTLEGASAVINGNLVDDGGAANVVLSAPAGTTLSGTGTIPSISVDNTSVGNQISGFPRLVSQGLGAGAVWGGGDDDFTTPDGNISFVGGAASSLTVNFPANAGGAAHFGNLTMAAGGTLNLASNVIMTGNMTVPAGTIAIGDFILDHQGIAPSLTSGAAITSSATGKLLFQTGSPSITVAGANAAIAANFEYSADGGTFTLPAGGTNLTISGNLTLTDKTAAAGGASFDIGAGRTLTASGSQVNVGANSGFVATAGGVTGILKLDVAAPNTLLTYNTPAASAVANLTVADNIALGGGILGGTLTVNGTASGFVHNGGDINIGTANLMIGNATATIYNRTAGTYSGDGFLIWNSTSTFTHTIALSINRLRVTQNLALISAAPVTVNDWLDLDGGIFDHTVGTPAVAELTIGDAGGVIVEVDGTGNLAATAGNLPAAFGAGPTDYRFTNASSIPNTFTWPATQARNVLINLAGAANTVILGAGENKTINGDLDITLGDLVWDGPTVVTIASGSTITRRDNGSILNRDADGDAGTVGGEIGTFTAPNVNLAYVNSNANINTAIEYSLPTVVNNFTLLPDNDGVAGTVTNVTIVSSRDIAGALTLSSVLNFAAATVTSFTSATRQDIEATGTVNVLAPGATPTIVNWNAGLDVLGAYVNNSTTNVTGGLTATGAVTNNGIMNIDGYTQTAGGLTQLAGSTINLTGDAVFNNLVLPATPAAPAIVVAPIVTTNSDVEINGTVTNTLLDFVFNGAAEQTLALGTNRTINNLTVAKTSDAKLNVTEGNLTLNAAVAGGQPNGILTLTRGVVDVANPNMLTLQLSAAGGFITSIGYVRNPANQTDLAHVVGRLGVALPAGIIGRAEWPVGSDDAYRPASLTFTAGNALIAPTTIVVEHVDGTPAGEVNLPLNGGVKFDDPNETNWIGDKAPYSWLVRATTSLGASQKFDIELQGTGLNKPFQNVNDLRIIRRFDGDVNVNGWFLQGAPDMYSNILQENQPAVGDTIVTARNQNSQGGIVTQAAFFTIGIPVGVQTEFNVTGTVTYENTANTPLEGVTVTLTPGGLTGTTNAAGAYTITGVGNGTYTVTASSDATWPGANATDALKVLLHTVSNPALTGLPLAAADVNNSNSVSSLDALQILRRDAGLIDSFAKGDWVFSSPSVTVNNADAVANVKGLAVGDVNESDVPGTVKAGNSISFTKDGKVNVNIGKAISVPVKVGSDVSLNAMSITLTYDASLATFEGVSSKAQDMTVNAANGKVQISWASLAAVDVKANEALFTLNFKQTKEFKAGSVLDVTVDNAVSELADAKGNVVGAALKIASVEGFVPSEFALKQNYPNPFNPTTKINYDLPVNGQVKLVVFNSLGEEVAQLVNEMQTAGTYTFDWNAQSLTSGVYFYRIDVKAGDKSFSKTNKMILMK